ncbi:MAG: prepilin-type N-terminal cleavage/methylation domain-containing protein [Bacilli bacterium]|nr:prepilin-type N-terminal cleavage/methylation domain-containing protein [Bacilli bacterium]
MKKSGFTLIELLAVIFVLGIISAIAIPTINRVTQQSREELYKSQIKNIELGAKDWATTNFSILPEGDGEVITLTLGQLKLGGFVDKNITNPQNKKLFPNDLEITITKKNNNYEYDVIEGSGGVDGEIDSTKPVIILNGLVHETVELNSVYNDLGVIAKDPTGALIDTVDVLIKSNNEPVTEVDTSSLIQYKITYTATYQGNASSAIRTVTVKDTIPPILTIPGNIEIGVNDVEKFNALTGVITTDNSLKTPTLVVSGNLSKIPGTYSITYISTDGSGNKTVKVRTIKVTDKPLYSDNTGAPIPVLETGMIPVRWYGPTSWAKADVYDNWYDYNNKEWANVVLVNETSRIDYMNAPAGTEIRDEDILAHLVWIPRYKYKLFNTLGTVTSNQEIEVIFESTATGKSSGNTNGTYLTHPAFTYDNRELEGIWVGKFETTGSMETPSIKPNSKSLLGQTVSSAFSILQKFNNETKYGLALTTDARMLKNTEWGAVAYLSHSKYGINNNLTINDNSLYMTGDGNYITNSSQSTTGNVYGIYDMSGGADEYVMGAHYNPDNTTISVATSGFEQSTIDSNSMNKYINKYASTEDTSGKLGDATLETNGWYGNQKIFIDTTSSWFLRGGAYGNGPLSGVFSYNQTVGNYTTAASRLVIPGFR